VIRIKQDDCDAFVRWLAPIVNEIVATTRPESVHLIELDHWFDQKWVGFSGKALGALGVWASELTVPPFHPHRVLGEHHYEKSAGAESYTPLTGGPRLHREQVSSQNLQRRMTRVAPDTACFWYTGDATATGRGALMAYIPAQPECWVWYIGVVREGECWRPVTLAGIASEEVTHIEAAARARRAG
jgi:hypothetical protein